MRKRKTEIAWKENQRFYEQAISRTNNLKPLYNLIKNEKRPQTKLNMLKNDRGQLITTDNEIVHIIKKCWQNIFDNKMPRIDEINNFSLENKIQEPGNNEINSQFTLIELKKAMRQIKPGTSVGPSDIPPACLKNLSPQAEEYLLRLFQLWWNREYFPEEGQNATVTLLHKGGDPHEISRYRTLSLNCNLCKLYLRIITNRLYKVTEKYNLFGEFQTGFRKNRRTTDNLLVLSTVVKKMKIEKNDGYLAFLDISKAYDRVDRKLLWQKMEKIGFDRKLINVLKGIYRKPTATLVWDEDKQPIKNLEMPNGLRQGCVLSPLLFLIYIADIINRITNLPGGVNLEFIVNNHVYERNVNCLVFADDILLIAKSENALNILLHTLYCEATKSRLEFSGGKSQILPIKRRPQYTWSIKKTDGPNGGDTCLDIEEKETAKYLGVIISRRSDIFLVEKENLISKTRKLMWSLFKIAYNTGRSNWFGPIIWNKYAIPTILYGTEAMSMSIKTLTKLQRIQNRYLKMCCGAIQRTPTISIIIHTGVLPLKIEYEKRLLNYFLHCYNLPWHKMIKQALLQQKLWSYGDTNRNWFGTARQILITVGLWQNFINYNPEERLWTKTFLKRFFRELEYIQIWEKLKQYPYLNHLKEDTPKSEKNVRTDNNSRFWLTARMGGLPYTSIRSRGVEGPENICPLCNNGEDTLKHTLLQCEFIIQQNNEHLPGWSADYSRFYKNSALEDLFLNNIFNRNKTPEEILQIGTIIRNKIKYRFERLR